MTKAVECDMIEPGKSICPGKTSKGGEMITPEKAKKLGMPRHLFDGYMAFVQMVDTYRDAHHGGE